MSVPLHQSSSGLSTKVGVTSQPTKGILILTSKAAIIDEPRTHKAFYLGSGHLNSGCLASVTSTLDAEPSPSP